MSGNNKSKQEIIQEYQKLASGLASTAPNAVFLCGGQSYSTAQIGQLVAVFLKTALAVAPAKALWAEAVQAQEATEATTGKTLESIREVVGLAYASSPATLDAVGITPRKARTPLSVEALAAAKAKAAATRAARGTTSKKQKAKVTGNVTGVNITPVVAPGSAPSTTGTSAPVVPPAAQAVNGAARS